MKGWLRGILYFSAIVIVVASLVILRNMHLNYKEGDIHYNELPQFAPMHRTHYVEGHIFLEKKLINSTTLLYQNPEHPKELIITELKNGKFKFDINALPSGWRVNDTGIIQITWHNTTWQKIVKIKDVITQKEDIYLTMGT